MGFRVISVAVSVVLIVVGIWSGYFVGGKVGYYQGLGEGYNTGNTTGYNCGYMVGFEKGKQSVVPVLESCGIVPKAVTYGKVAEFIKADKTDENKFVNQYYDCVSFTKTVRENANKLGIKCGVDTFTLEGINGGNIMGHAINCFETTDRGIVYFDPQTDGQRYGIYVGGTYTLQGVVYKITKVDVIW